MIKGMWLVIAQVLCICTIAKTQVDTLVHRSEYEQVGDVVFDVDDLNEGAVTYSIVNGNSNNYYIIDPASGVISIANTITDVFDVIHQDILTIDASGTTHNITVVDGYDYLVQNLPASYTVLDDHQEVTIDNASSWTAYNNLWGKGSAVPNVDFRIATIHKNTIPDSTIFLWDTPSQASAYGGASVWCYHNVFLVTEQM